MSIIRTIICVLALLFLLGGCLIVLTSCHASERCPDRPPVIPDTVTKILYQTLYRMNWLVTLSIIGIAISVAAFVNGSKAALPIGMGSLAALGMTLATIRYAQWIAFCSFIAALLIFVATVLKKNIALKQIIVGVQKVKDYYATKEGISRENTNNLLTAKQNKDTTKLVLNTKTDLKLKGLI